MIHNNSLPAGTDTRPLRTGWMIIDGSQVTVLMIKKLFHEILT